jgi:hypothetical protein
MISRLVLKPDLETLILNIESIINVKLFIISIDL